MPGDSVRIGLVYNAILPAKNYGGVERMTVWLARELKRRGHEPVVFGRKGSRLPLYETVEMGEDWQKWFEQNHSSYHLDFVHFQEPYRLKPNFPYLVTVYGNAQPGETFLPNTNFVSRSHALNHNSEIFVYNGVPVDDYPFLEKKDDYYVFMANDRRVKNLKTAVTWALDLGVRLEVIGAHGINRGGVHFRGPMSDSDGRLEILGQARALVSPYNWEEPFAVAPLEALACGVPLISSANGSLPEVTLPEVGVVCRSYSEMLHAPMKIQKITPRHCRAFLKQHFSIEQTTQGYLDLYQRILHEGELAQNPRYAFDPSRIQWLYKPTWTNELRFRLTGKI